MSLSFTRAPSNRTVRMCCALFLAALSVAWVHNAMAVLGQPLPPGSSTTPGSTARAIGTTTSGLVSAKAAATPATASAGNYTVSKTVLENGTTISEYATPAGLVFALSWQGPFMPDLNSLLGTYFSAFKTQTDASRSTRNIGTPVSMDTGKLVVHSSGRMRNYTGYAYAKDLIPGGVNISDVLP